MERIFLSFEEPIVGLTKKIEELKQMQQDSELNLADEISLLQNKLDELTKELYANLDAWQVCSLARHQHRPRTLDYINSIFTDFTELHGDRHLDDDKSIVGGFAKFGDTSVMVLGHQKGADTKENIARNFGMSRPEGYRKALRLMKLAEKFNLPIITFVDTPGAYPGIGAEERNQSEAIGFNLYELAKIKTPVIATVIGEGGSGGALAIAVADQVNMLEFSIYSVISPEACASILWKNAAKAAQAADILGITSKKLKELNLIDAIIAEPAGGAHQNIPEVMESMRKTIKKNLTMLAKLSQEELLARRMERLMGYGQFEEISND